MSERLLTPQQELFLSYYTDPKSETFSNAYRSASKAEYSEEYAQNITGQLPEWLSETISDLSRLRKAERNLDKALEIDPTDEKIGDRGLKASIFVAQGLGKSKYSTRTEQTGANGSPLTVKFDNQFNVSPSPQTETNS